jgi:hypothetical protein
METWKKEKEIPRLDCYSAHLIIWELLSMMLSRWIKIKKWFIRLKFINHSQELLSLDKHLLLIMLHIIKIINRTTIKMKILCTGAKLIKNGVTIIQTKKDSMEHLLHFRNMSKKVSYQKIKQFTKAFGSNLFI